MDLFKKIFFFGVDDETEAEFKKMVIQDAKIELERHRQMLAKLKYERDHFERELMKEKYRSTAAYGVSPAPYLSQGQIPRGNQLTEKDFEGMMRGMWPEDDIAPKKPKPKKNINLFNRLKSLL